MLLLSKYTDNQIKSFWYFLFDGPHPQNYQKEFEKIHAAIAEINPRIAYFMQEAFDRLLSEDHCPGH